VIVRGADGQQRPEIAAPVLEVHIIDQTAVSPGLIFLAPQSKTFHDFAAGLYIYNNGGVKHTNWSRRRNLGR
jgi:hypothetical protein